MKGRVSRTNLAGFSSAFVLSKVEIFLKKHVPNAIQLLVVPITTIVVTGVLALGIIGPVTRHIGDLLTAGLVGYMKQYQ